MISTVDLERLAARGWQGTSTERLGEWLLRAGSGFTGRANSVLPLGSPGCSVDTALTVVTRFYAAHGLVPLFQIPVGTQTAALDDDLTARRWETFNRSRMLVADLEAAVAACPAPGGGPAAQFAGRASAAWLAGYQYRGAPLPPSAVAVLENAENVVFGSFPDPAGGAAAVVRGVLTDGWLGVTALTVDDRHRRSGLGTRLMAELMRWASVRGAGQVYLQVAAENTAALALYERLAFSAHHEYHYRRPARQG